jgi:Fe-S oxidoreductase
VLFDDTFNNHFRPQTAKAAQQLLEAAGCAVELPSRRMCCGRPYYDYGMLDRAKSALERALDVLAPDLDAGAPIVVLEPGCLSVFRDEMKQLLPRDARAQQLERKVVSLAEVLKGKNLPGVKRRVMLHGHCHQKALWGTGADVDVLREAGCEVLTPDTGCCGMSGSFGYRPEFYEASKRIAAGGGGRKRLLVPGADRGSGCKAHLASRRGTGPGSLKRMSSPRRRGPMFLQAFPNSKASASSS